MHKLIKISLLSVSLLIVSAGAIAANIPAISLAYPLVPKTLVEFITTMPSLFIILTVPISHKVARKIGYKLTVQIGVFMVLTAGIAPVFVHSFGLLFMSRVLFGVGIGLINPLLFSFATQLYKGQELSSVIGLQSACEGIGGMLITFSVGQLLITNWRLSFLAYLIALPILLLFTSFVPKVTPIIEKEKNKLKKVKSTNTIYGYFILLILVVTIYMSFSIKSTALLLEKGIGTATDGSNLLALVGLGSMLAGFLFGRTLTFTKSWTVAISFLGLGISLFIIAYSQTIIWISIASIFCGFSFRTFVPYLFNEVNQNQAGNSERDTALLLIGFNLGAAFTPMSIALLERIIPFKDSSGIFFTEGLIMFLLAIGAVSIQIKSHLKMKDL
ncbi:MFS transporter [Carnobacterium maltaromaticum]|uniref:MFS transporter n=1 Tax=Carnobacterium maltaromaticum TaxID=2751 RepID=UPI0009D41895|nr:Major Facilitator Superfamily protein [Carnobacterium maltaromaticum]